MRVVSDGISAIDGAGQISNARLRGRKDMVYVVPI